MPYVPILLSYQHAAATGVQVTVTITATVTEPSSNCIPHIQLSPSIILSLTPHSLTHPSLSRSLCLEGEQQS